MQKYLADINAQYGPDLNGTPDSTLAGVGTSVCKVLEAVSGNASLEASAQQSVATLIQTKIGSSNTVATGIVNLIVNDLCPAAEG